MSDISDKAILALQAVHDYASLVVEDLAKQANTAAKGAKFLGNFGTVALTAVGGAITYAESTAATAHEKFNEALANINGSLYGAAIGAIAGTPGGPVGMFFGATVGAFYLSSDIETILNSATTSNPDGSITKGGVTYAAPSDGVASIAGASGYSLEVSGLDSDGKNPTKIVITTPNDGTLELNSNGTAVLKDASGQTVYTGATSGLASNPQAADHLADMTGGVDQYLADNNIPVSSSDLQAATTHHGDGVVSTDTGLTQGIHVGENVVQRGEGYTHLSNDRFSISFLGSGEIVASYIDPNTGQNIILRQNPDGSFELFYSNPDGSYTSVEANSVGELTPEQLVKYQELQKAIGKELEGFRQSTKEAIDEVEDLPADAEKAFNEIDNRLDRDGEDGDVDDIPQSVQSLFDKILTAITRASPLVLDMDESDTIDLVNVSSVDAVYFDVDNNGFAEVTGWTTGGDGFLAIDLNEDGTINNGGELFGNQTGYDNGFLALSSYDINGDGKISSEDQVWGALRVWIDINQNGYSEEMELYTLENLNITDISSVYTDVSYDIAGNSILQEGMFTMNGNAYEIADVHFATKPANSVYDQEFLLDIRVLFMPTLRGYGLLPDLHIAISLDNDDGDAVSLISRVTEFSELTAADIFAANTDALDLTRTIMFRWAGVENIDPDSRERFVDARELAFLEAMTGQPFLQNGIYPDPAQHAGSDLTVAFQMALNHVFATLAAQTEAGALFTGDFYYNIATDSFDGITGIDTAVLDGLETEATGLANTAARETFWQNAIRLIENVIGIENLDGTTQTAIDDAITSSDVTLDLEGIQESLFTEVVSFPLAGTAGDDVLTGSSQNDVIQGNGGNDTFYGGSGNDDLYGSYGNDVFYGGADDEIIFGFAANDNRKCGNKWRAARAA